MTDSQQANEIKAGNTFLEPRKQPSPDVAALAKPVRDALDLLHGYVGNGVDEDVFMYVAGRDALAALEERAAQAEALVKDLLESTDIRVIRLEAELRDLRSSGGEAGSLGTAPKEGVAAGCPGPQPQLSAPSETAAARADRLQHIIDCADTPLMRDVLAERDRLETALRDLIGQLETSAPGDALTSAGASAAAGSTGVAPPEDGSRA